MSEYCSACSAACGWCGGCTSAYDRLDERGPESIDICPICKTIVERVYVPVAIDNHTVLICCGDVCAAALKARCDVGKRSA